MGRERVFNIQNRKGELMRQHLKRRKKIMIWTGNRDKHNPQPKAKSIEPSDNLKEELETLSENKRKIIIGNAPKNALD